PNVKVVSIDPPLFQEGLELYKSRTDKTWGLVDCISFIVMTRNKLSQALTADRHFKQAGFQTLL
ncbi:MAG: type II toxin-antitoxin system VapC family toxin, partial [Prochlorothrix sp.]